MYCRPSLLPEPGEHFPLDIEGKAYFRIYRDQLPEDWQPEHLIISVRFSDPKNTGAVLEFNGKKWKLDETYHQIDLLDIAADYQDIVFSVSSGKKRRIDIVWWANMTGVDVIKTEAVKAGKDEKGTALLPDKSTDYFCHSGSRKGVSLKISREYFPEDWKPAFYVVGISIWSKISHYEDFEFNGRTERFHDNYTEIRYEAAGVSSDIEFNIRTVKKRKLKIVWWAE
jgi:hypothetical protein